MDQLARYFPVPIFLSKICPTNPYPAIRSDSLFNLLYNVFKLIPNC